MVGLEEQMWQFHWRFYVGALLHVGTNKWYPALCGSLQSPSPFLWLWNWLGDYKYFFPLSSWTLFLHTCSIIPLCSAISPYKLEWSYENNHRIFIQVWKFFPRRQQLDSQNKASWSPNSCQIGIGVEDNYLVKVILSLGSFSQPSQDALPIITFAHLKIHLDISIRMQTKAHFWHWPFPHNPFCFVV